MLQQPSKSESDYSLKEFELLIPRARDSNNTTISMDEFRNDMLKSIRDIESHMERKFETFKEDFIKKMEESQKTKDNLIVTFDTMRESFLADRAKIERIPDLTIFQKKTTDQITTHDVRINALQTNLANAIFKYDKLFLDNLTVPGTIGEYCKFKNIKEYIENNMVNVGSLLTFKEKQISDMKKFKEKIESMVKGMGMTLDTTEKSIKLWTSKLMELTEEGYKKEISHVGDKLSDLRMENHKYAFNLQKAATDLTVENDKIQNIRSEIYKKLDETVTDLKNSHKETVSNFTDTKSDFDNIKQKFNDLSEFIKDVRFRKNLGIDVSKKEIKQLVKNTTFGRKKSLVPNKNITLGVPVTEDKKPANSNNVSFDEEKDGDIESYVKKYIEGGKKEKNKSDKMLNQIQVTSQIEDRSILNPPKKKTSSTKSSHVIVELDEEHGRDQESINKSKNDISSIVKSIDINLNDERTESKDDLSACQVIPLKIPEDICIKMSKLNTQYTNKRFKDKFPNTNLKADSSGKLITVSVSTEKNKTKIIKTENDEKLNNSVELKITNLTDLVSKNIKNVNSTIKDFKSEISTKLQTSEKKLLDLESNTKKKLEELSIKINVLMPINSGASPFGKNQINAENNKDISFNNVNPVNLFNKYDLDRENLVHVNQLDVFQTAQKNIEPCVTSLRKKSARGVKPITNKNYTSKLADTKPSDIRSLSKDNKKLG